jgi:hypothetical protein
MYEKNNMIFLAFEIGLCTKTFFFFFSILEVLKKTGILIPDLYFYDVKYRSILIKMA